MVRACAATANRQNNKWDTLYLLRVRIVLFCMLNLARLFPFFAFYVVHFGFSFVGRKINSRDALEGESLFLSLAGLARCVFGWTACDGAITYVHL